MLYKSDIFDLESKIIDDPDSLFSNAILTCLNANRGLSDIATQWCMLSELRPLCLAGAFVTGLLWNQHSFNGSLYLYILFTIPFFFKVTFNMELNIIDDPDNPFPNSILTCLNAIMASINNPWMQVYYCHFIEIEIKFILLLLYSWMLICNWMLISKHYSGTIDEGI